jgi:hypothetical protein
MRPSACARLLCMRIDNKLCRTPSSQLLAWSAAALTPTYLIRSAAVASQRAQKQTRAFFVVDLVTVLATKSDDAVTCVSFITKFDTCQAARPHTAVGPITASLKTESDSVLRQRLYDGICSFASAQWCALVKRWM